MPTEIKVALRLGLDRDSQRGAPLTPEGEAILREILKRIAGPEPCWRPAARAPRMALPPGNTMLHEPVHPPPILRLIGAREWAVLELPLTRQMCWHE